MTEDDKKRKTLIESSLANLEIGQLKALSAMLFCAWPDHNKHSIEWNEQVRCMIAREINSRLREFV